ncbi:MAG: hypothetical protein GDA40_05770 [Rhodobacteraceae bacterium]|nr:hypothetical protein [Paracoccaceae bacterium]
MTKTLITGDFTLYQSAIWLPFRTEPRNGQPYVLGTLAAPEEDFDLYRKAIALNLVTDIYRALQEIRALGPN